MSLFEMKFTRIWNLKVFKSFVYFLQRVFMRCPAEFASDGGTSVEFITCWPIYWDISSRLNQDGALGRMSGSHIIKYTNLHSQFQFKCYTFFGSLFIYLSILFKEFLPLSLKLLSLKSKLTYYNNFKEQIEITTAKDKN